MDDERQRRIMERVAAGVAHEVRNPLNALQLKIQILEQELAELLEHRGHHVYQVLDKMTQELRSLDEFVAKFLRYARLPPLKLERLRVRPLLAELASLVAPQCSSKGVRLLLDLEDGAGTLLADGFQLKQALLDVILNAIEATQPGGRIDIQSVFEGPVLLIHVRDTGEGVPEGMEERVFDAFVTMREGGTGLGLPIARRIVEEHGGTLILRSIKGKGTTATLRLTGRLGS